MKLTAVRILLCTGLLLAPSAERAGAAEPDGAVKTEPASADKTEPLGVGDSLPEFSLKDQFGEQRFVDASVRVVLFSRDMEGGEILKAGLEGLPEGVLPPAHIVYVSDISGMPRMVARLFALPKMRKRSYAMLLDRTGEWTALLPGTPGRASFIHLDRLRIEQVEELQSAERVRQRIDELIAASKSDP